ncbi:hypothetical protein [Thiothrix subterranea]|uniref:DUF3800 domain-containing protein n=1 Tax=Thiothrix subterranea TaxID=2735563 RepID=A0AA51R340_9GAMM|nr:hypothetical protein [Thiothrix subterranea]MDQ5768063.1 hypothetical protein [Thiothrix subterranea]WML85175.1 hypothetical protein RCG00_12765 [Thiothrix subterranea]
MNYTLYIDESGDFESQKGQWVLSGILFSDSYENCEKHLLNKLDGMPRELNLTSIRDFHLTEFRRDFDHDKAVDMAKRVLDRLELLPFDFHGLVTINYSKISLSHREKTYRLMLADLLALCETVIPDYQIIENLDLVVATRTIDGELQTNISNIKEDIINTLPMALEVDLATKGIVDLIGKHIKVKMDYANRSWGLVCADFLANLSYHNRKEKEKLYLQELEKNGRYTVFESFGDFESRRASVAERDNDHVLSLYRWLMILTKNDANEKAKNTIQRLLAKIFYKRGTSGSKISFEALIERLWRSGNAINNYGALKITLSLFEHELKEFFRINKISSYQQYLFRLRNLMLIVDNHLGNVDGALELAVKQHEYVSQLASNPEHFQMILDFKAIEIEIYINGLEFTKALNLAFEYSRMISNYKEVWQLLVDEESDNFESSRAHIKSTMILFRANILNMAVNNYSISDQVMKDINNLEAVLSNKLDISRYSNYKIMLLLKQKKSNVAVGFFEKIVDENPNVILNYFDFFWFLKAINDTLLTREQINFPKITKIINSQLSYIDLNTSGHPMDLILRELALFEFQSNNKSKALKYIRKSKNLFTLESSNVSKWLNALIDIHEDYFKGSVGCFHKYFKEIDAECDFIESVSINSIDSLLQKVRFYTPY